MSEIEVAAAIRDLMTVWQEARRDGTRTKETIIQSADRIADDRAGLAERLMNNFGLK